MTRRAILATILLFLFAGCGSDDGTFTSSPSTTGGNSAGVPALETETVTAQINLPEDYPLQMQSLSVMNPLGQAKPDSQGRFQMEKFTGGSQLALVLDADGDPVLIGWLHEGATLSIGSTAEVLLYFGVGGPHLPGELRVQLEELLPGLQETEQLSLALRGILTRRPKSLNEETEEIPEALAEAVNSVMTSPQVGRILSNPSPGDKQSGIQLDFTESANQIRLTNTYRRRAQAFIKRVSYVDEQGVTQPAPLLVEEVPMPPIGGISNLVGGLKDAGIILLGFQEGNQLAYQPRTFDPITLRTVEGARKTNFEILAVGPGDFVGELNRLTEAELEVQEDVTVRFVVGDLALQMFFSLLLPNSETYSKKLEQLLGVGGSTVIGDLINTAKALNPNIADRAAQGDVLGALQGAYDLVISSGTFRSAVLSFAGNFFFNGVDTEEFFEKGRNIFRTTGAVDLALATFDTGAIGVAIAESNMADVWELEVLPPDIVLRPENPDIVIGEEVSFQVTVPEVDSGVPLVYRWSTEGALGELTDGREQNLNEFDTTSASVTYSAGQMSGSETVTVEVFEVVEPGAGGTRRSLGTATTTVNIGAVRIEPGNVTLSPDEQQEFTVIIPENLRDRATYRWELANDTGALSSQTEETIVYSVRDTIQAPASEVLSVEVMIEDSGQDPRLFGTATADITISDVDIVITPDGATLEPGGTQSFTAQVFGAPIGANLVYEWESVNGLGSVLPGDEANTTYTVSSSISPPKSEIIRVRVFHEANQSQLTLLAESEVPVEILSPGPWVKTRVGASNFTEVVQKISFSGGNFLIAGLDNASSETLLVVSTDANSWTTVNPPSFVATNSVVQANDQHLLLEADVIANETLFSASTTNTTSFEPLGNTAPLSFINLAFGNGIYVGVGVSSQGVDQAGFSQDLVDWEMISNPNVGGRAVRYFNGLFVAGGTHISSSDDGQTWATHYDLASNGLLTTVTSLAFGQSRYAAVTNGNFSESSSILYSENLSDWQQVGPLEAPDDATFVNLNGVAFGDGRFIAVGGTSLGAAVIYESVDGENWTLVPVELGEQLIDVAYGNGVFATVGQFGTVLTEGD